MDLLFFLVIVSFPFATALVVYYNRFNALKEPVLSLDATLDASIARKRELGGELRNVAAAASSFEYSTHSAIINKIADAAEKISKGESPAIVLANLAARFPELRSIDTFERIQIEAGRLEQKIYEEMSQRNSIAEMYNLKVTKQFPANIFAFILNFERFEYRKDGKIFELSPTISSENSTQGESSIDDRINQILRRR